MKTTGQIAAFLVMVAALMATVWVVGGVDLDTQSNTAPETRLPFILDTGAQAAADVQGFQMRYPRGWRAEPASQGFEVSRAVNALDQQGPRYSFDFSFLPQAGVGGPRDLIGAESITDSPADSPYPWARSEVETLAADGQAQTALLQAVALNEAGDYLLIANTTPLDPGDLEAITEDLNAMVASISLGEDFAIFQDIYTYALPAEWAETPSGDRALVQVVYPVAAVASGQFEAIVRVQTGDAAATVTALNDFLTVPASISLEGLDDPLAIMAAFEGFAGDEAVQMAQALAPAEYMGYSGQELGYVLPGGELYVTVLDTQDGRYTILLRAFQDSPLREQYLADIASILGSLAYNSGAAEAALAQE
jgi:hypothetical protein